MSPKTDRPTKVTQDVESGALKLPILHDVTVPNSMVSKDGGNKKTLVNVSRLTKNDALTLLNQYNNNMGSNHLSGDFPHIKMNIKKNGQRTLPARERFTTKSMERVDRTSRRLFTEGLSSKSRFMEPSLAMHRRDIIGANMPETVRIARERSNIVFGVNHYRPRRQNNAPIRSRVLNIQMEPASVTANQIMAPLSVPQKADLGNVWEDNSKRNEGRIARMLQGIAEKYGREIVEPTPSPQSVRWEYVPPSSTTATTPATTPRKSPSLQVKTGKPNLSVVSLGESLSGLPNKQRPVVRVPRQSKNDTYNKVERFRQHAYEKKEGPYEMKLTTKNDKKSGLYNPVIGELRPRVSLRPNSKSGTKKKRQIIVTLKDVTDDVEHDDGVSESRSREPEPNKGRFTVEGVQGVGTGHRLWSPSSVSTSASVANPPPSVEVGLYDLEFPNVRDPAAIFKIESGDNSHLNTAREALLSGGQSSHVSSTHLSVPSLTSRQEYPPSMEAMWREKPPQKNDPLAGLGGDNVGSGVDDKAPEVDYCESHMGPAISISDSDEVETDLERQRQEREQGQGDVGPKVGGKSEGHSPVSERINPESNEKGDHKKVIKEGKGIDERGEECSLVEGEAPDTHRSSVHSKSITFISPLHTQTNAKRQ